MRKKPLVLLLFCFFKFGSLYCAPTISNVTFNQVTTQNDLYEIVFDLNTQYSNPYKETIINSYAEFWSPTGKYYKVLAFYFEGFTNTDVSNVGSFQCSPYPCESVTANQIKNWKIRFTPNEAGNWTFKITATDNSGSSFYPGHNSVKNFTCNTSTKPGFIVKANKRFLKRTTGEFFFPIGQNTPSFRWGSDINGLYGINDYKYVIDSLSNNNGNILRVWIDHYYALNIIGPDLGTGNIYFNLHNQKDSWRLDWIMNYANSKGINIMLCLFSDWNLWNGTDNTSSWDNYWDMNPFNPQNGGPLATPAEFLQNQQALEKQKDLIRYVVSRWGYSTNLMAWEFWNEVNQFQCQNPSVSFPSNYYDIVSTWHRDMYNYIKSIDPFKHLITTSFTGNVGENTTCNGISINNVNTFNYLDFTQSHLYYAPYDNVNLNVLSEMQNASSVAQLNIDMPYLIGEFGDFKPDTTSFIDPLGHEFHNALWSTCFSSSLGASLYWWDWKYITKNNLYSIYKPIGKFMKDLAVPSGSFKGFKILNTNGLNSFYMMNSNNDTIYGWTQDINFSYSRLYFNLATNGREYLKTLNPSYKPSSYSTNNNISIAVNQNNRQYNIIWYNANTGDIYQNQTSTSSGGLLTISIPTNLRSGVHGDAVFKAYLDCSKLAWREGKLNNNNQNIATSDFDLVSERNHSNVYYRTNNNSIKRISWNSILNVWETSDLNNAAINVAGDICISKDGKQVFYRTTNNSINCIKLVNNVWVWNDLNQAAGFAVKGPIAVNSLDQVFFRSNTNNLNNIWFDNSINKWVISNLNNVTQSNVGDAFAISSNDQVFYKTTDFKLRNIWWNNDPAVKRWVYSDLNLAANSNVCGNIVITDYSEVFYQTCNNKINDIYYDFSQNIWKWSDLNSSANNVAGDIEADKYYGRVFYRNTSNNLNAIYRWNGIWYSSTLDNATNQNVTPGSIACDNFGNVYFKGTDNYLHRAFKREQCYYSAPENECLGCLRLLNEDFIIDQRNEELEINKNIEVKVFPNPNEGVFNLIASSDFKTDCYIDIVDVLGKKIKTVTGYKTNEIIEIDLTGIGKSLYIINVFDSFGKLIGNSRISVK